MSENLPQFNQPKVVPPEPHHETPDQSAVIEMMLARAEAKAMELEAKIADRLGPDSYSKAEGKLDLLVQKIAKQWESLMQKGTGLVESAEKIEYTIPRIDLTLRIIPRSKLVMRMVAIVAGGIGSFPVPGPLLALAIILWNRSNQIPDTNKLATATV